MSESVLEVSHLQDEQKAYNIVEEKAVIPCQQDEPNHDAKFWLVYTAICASLLLAALDLVSIKYRDSTEYNLAVCLS